MIPLHIAASAAGTGLQRLHEAERNLLDGIEAAMGALGRLDALKSRNAPFAHMVTGRYALMVAETEALAVRKSLGELRRRLRQTRRDIRRATRLAKTYNREMALRAPPTTGLDQ